jgi:hypothetical protein
VAACAWLHVTSATARARAAIVSFM